MLITDPTAEQFWPGQSEELAALLPGRADVVAFTALEVAYGHGQPLGRQLTDQGMFDWVADRLADRLAVVPSAAGAGGRSRGRTVPLPVGVCIIASMIPLLPFGTTGHASTRVLFGAAAFSEVTQDEADVTLELVQRHGLNHLDTAASYGDAELRLAPFLQDHRDDVFLATKTGERDAEAAWAEINRSLERMQTDHVDLLQLHNLVDEAEWQQAYATGGVLEAAVRARDEGLVRNIGVTGHGITVATQHLRSLERFDFASVLLPYNFPMARNEAYLDQFEALATVCAERGVALQTIKSITRAPWADGAEQHAATWYEPLKDPAAIDTAVAWVLGRPDVFLNTVGDIHVLPLVLDAAERFFDGGGARRPDGEVMADLERRWDMAPLFV